MNESVAVTGKSMSETGRASYMVLSIDNFNLYIPREDIKAFESIHELDTGELGRQSIGWVRHMGEKIPVYCFTKDFDISTYKLENRSICVVLDKVNIAIMCSDIRAMSETIENIVSLPKCMSESNTPISGFCLFKKENGSRLGMLCSPASIKKFIDSSHK